jgi:hypothetical protein
MKLDSKVHGIIIKNKDNTIIPDDEYIVFRPSDNAVPDMLAFYHRACLAAGASVEQIKAVQGLMDRVREWRLAHPGRCKVADVQPGELT